MQIPNFLVGAVVACAPVSALAVTLDDFTQGEMLVNSASTEASAFVGPATRELEIYGITNGAGTLDPFAQVVTAGDGVLAISNGSGDDSTVSLTYDFGFGFDAGSILDLTVNYLDSDGGALDTTTSLDVTIGGATIYTNNFIFDATSPFSVFVPLTAAQRSQLGGGANLAFIFNGGVSYDLSLSSIEFTQSPGGLVPVPAPAGLGLLGLGLLGLGVRLRGMQR